MDTNDSLLTLSSPTNVEARTSAPPDLTSETLAALLRARGYRCRSRAASEYPRAPFRNDGLPPNPEWVLEVSHQEFFNPNEDQSFKRIATLFLTQEEGIPVCLVVYHTVPWVAFLHQHLVQALDSLGHPNMPLRFLPAERVMLQRSGESDADEGTVSHSERPFARRAAAWAEWVEWAYMMYFQFSIYASTWRLIVAFFLVLWVIAVSMSVFGWSDLWIGTGGFAAAFAILFGLCRYLATVGPKLRAAASGERVEDVKQQRPWKWPEPEERKTFILHALSDPDPEYDRLRGQWWVEEIPDPAGLAADFVQYVHREQLEGMLEWLTSEDMLQAVVIALGIVGNEETLRKLRRFSDRPTQSQDLQKAIRDSMAELRHKDGDRRLKGAAPVSYNYKEQQAGELPSR